MDLVERVRVFVWGEDFPEAEPMTDFVEEHLSEFIEA